MVLVDPLRARALLLVAVLALVARSVYAQAPAAAPSPAAAIVAPSVLESPPPHYPETELSEGHEHTVILHVTVAADGSVSDAHVDHSGGEAFDQAALENIKLWKFSPAKRGDTPMASSVRVAVRFTPPDFDLSDHGPVLTPQSPPAPPPVARPAQPEPAPSPAVAPAQPLDDSRTTLGAAAKVQHTALRPEARGSSDFVIEREVLQAAPHKDASAMLATAPGVYVARSEGDAVAPHVFLRGFDAEHGQDIAFSAGGIPINLPSHLHGQGYADLNFVPTEAVRYVRVTEGIYDPRQGDFAVAGSVDFELGVPERGILSRTSYGSFGTLHQLVLWAPEGEPVESFGAATYGSTDGFGEHRDGQHAGVIAQHVMASGRWKGRVLASFYGARSRLAGVVRQSDVDSGAVDFYGVYADPVAQNQSAFASEGKLGLFAEHHGEEGSESRVGVWLALHSFRLQEAFTGYTERSQINPEWAGRGDLIEQQNHATTLGLTAGHRTRRYELASWARAALEAGLTGRLDRIDQTQNLLQAPQNETWDQRIDATIDGSDIGAYVDLELRLHERLTVRAGARGNALHYSVDDRLGNFIPSFRRDSYIVGFRRSAAGFAAGPRASAELAITSWLSVLAAYGQGYRSPQARLLEDGESAPFTKVHSGDVGARLKLAPEDRVVVSASGFYTTLSDDVAFDPAEGRLEPIGPTTRKGITAHVVARPWSFLVSSASLTYVRAELDEPPPATAEDPAPPYRQGELLPYVPPLVVRLDVGAHHALTKIEGKPLDGRVGIGFSHLAPRPLPFQAESDALSLFDASASLRYRAVELGIEAFNLFDLQYAATEHVFASSWQPSEVPSRLPERHIAAGPPRTVLVTLGLHL